MTNQEKSQKKPHVHAELIKAWADGNEVQYFSGLEHIWVDTDTPRWTSSAEYRIKPSEKRLKGEYRVALFSNYAGSNVIYTSTIDDKQQEEDWQNLSHFKGWLTDWIEYDVIDPKQE